MAYQVLARKWRPQAFEDVVGQEHITRTLQNAISTNRLAHAFLFSGPRGVGKTTTARILAKALNCKEGPTPRPCGKCDSCREIAAGSSVDVIEIDGASNRGIEHIRELREAVHYAPAAGKYKVYVIDEVHMLTNEAFNALLKTLEEPPPHVIFIFATTEPQKIPATIHSRCQRYGFKRISIQDLTRKLGEIARTEGIEISPAGLAMIARAAEGSMRDCQSLLDQAVSYSGLSVKDDDLRTVLGIVSLQSLLSFTDALLKRDAAGLLLQVDLLIEQGQDIRQFLQGITEHLRNLLVAKTAQEPEKIIELPPDDISLIKKQAESVETERLLMLFDSLSKTLDDMKKSHQQRFILEAGLVKACSIKPLKPLSEVMAHLKGLEAKIQAVSLKASYADSVKEQPAGYGRSKPPGPPASSMPPPPKEIETLWSDVLSSLKQKKPLLYSALRNSSPLSLTESTLVIGMEGSSFEREQAEKREHKELIAGIVSDQLNRRVTIQVQSLAAETAEPLSRPSKRRLKQEPPAVQDALRIFGGEIIEQGEKEKKSKSE